MSNLKNRKPIKENTTYRKGFTISNIAAIITFSGFVLYGLGWLYWTNYLSVFNIDKSFFEMDVNKAIVSTLHYAFFVIIMFSQYLCYLYKGIKNENFSLLFFILTTISGVYLTAIYFVNDEDIKNLLNALSILLVVCLLVFKPLFLTRFRKQSINKEFVLLFSFIFLFTPVFYYIHQSKKDAKNFIRNYRENIELTTNDNSKIISGKLILFMNEKYFIMTKINNK
ncbi:hypothetical protein [Flavobacterium xinjiangense]|nr:hypothetical protein [Flavobacterium xinjiangense]